MKNLRNGQMKKKKKKMMKVTNIYKHEKMILVLNQKQDLLGIPLSRAVACNAFSIPLLLSQY